MNCSHWLPQLAVHTRATLPLLDSDPRRRRPPGEWAATASFSPRRLRLCNGPSNDGPRREISPQWNGLMLGLGPSRSPASLSRRDAHHPSPLLSYASSLSPTSSDPPRSPPPPPRAGGEETLPRTTAMALLPRTARLALLSAPRAYSAAATGAAQPRRVRGARRQRPSRRRPSS